MRSVKAILVVSVAVFLTGVVFAAVKDQKNRLFFAGAVDQADSKSHMAWVELGSKDMPVINNEAYPRAVLHRPDAAILKPFNVTHDYWVGELNDEGRTRITFAKSKAVRGPFTSAVAETHVKKYYSDEGATEKLFREFPKPESIQGTARYIHEKNVTILNHSEGLVTECRQGIWFEILKSTTPGQKPTNKTETREVPSSQCDTVDKAFCEKYEKSGALSQGGTVLSEGLSLIQESYTLTDREFINGPRVELQKEYYAPEALNIEARAVLDPKNHTRGHEPRSPRVLSLATSKKYDAVLQAKRARLKNICHKYASYLKAQPQRVRLPKIGSRPDSQPAENRATKGSK
jgi:hypothetical protein